MARFKPVAYVTSGAPVEILETMGVLTLYPENYGALCGAQRVAVKLCQVAEAAGYSPDLCSYARGHIGSVMQPQGAGSPGHGGGNIGLPIRPQPGRSDVDGLFKIGAVQGVWLVKQGQNA